MPIRPNAQRAAARETHHVFLYDAAHADAVRERAARFFRGVGDDDAECQRALQALAAEGKLIVYETEDDAGTQAEIMVGKPLSAREKGERRWHKPQKAFLDLPSGVLRFEGWSSLGVHPDEEPMEEGAAVELTPGRYAVTLHRAENADEDEASEIIVLTPTGEEHMPRADALLEIPLSTHPEPGTITEGVFSGLVLGHESQELDWDVAKEKARNVRMLRVNLTGDQAEELGLRSGMRLVLEADGRTLEAYFMEVKGAEFRAGYGPEAWARVIRDPGIVAFVAHTGSGQYHLHVGAHPDGGRQRDPLLKLAEQTPITVRCTEPPFDRWPAPEPAVLRDGEAEVIVVASHPGNLILGITLAAWRELQPRDDAILELQVDGRRFDVVEGFYSYQDENLRRSKRELGAAGVRELEVLRQRIIELHEGKHAVCAAEAELLYQRRDELTYPAQLLARQPLEVQMNYFVSGRSAVRLRPRIEPLSAKHRYGAPVVPVGGWAVVRPVPGRDLKWLLRG